MPTYPEAERLDLVDDYRGRPVPDPYRWLEAADDPRTQAWRAAQDALMADERAAWQSRDAFADRIEALMGSGSVSPPYDRGDWAFFTRRNPGQQFPVLYVRLGDGEPRALFDPIAIDPNGLTTLDSWQPSKEGDRVAVQYSIGGDEESILAVIDTASGERLEDGIDRCRYAPVAWLPGGQQFYYVRRIAPELLPEAEQQFHRRVYLHTVGTDAESTDVLIFGAGMTKTNYYGVEVSRNGRWLQVSASEGTEPRNDLWMADLESSSVESPAFRLIQGDVDAQTGVHVGRNNLMYVSTDLDAPRGRLLVATPEELFSHEWRELLPEDPEAVLEGYAILDGPHLMRPVLLVAWTRHVVSELTVHDLETGELLRRVDLPGAGTVAGPLEQPNGGPVAWFIYTDHTTVPTVYTFDERTGEVALWEAPPGSVDVPSVHSQQVTYTSVDGTSVRMFVISPTTAPDRPRPTILYGYGGFGIPLSPAYSASILSWVEAGGVWAVANLRGGGEEGEEWHRAGMLGNKQNVFDDFHAAAQWLIDNGWTTSEQLAINGGSNGGLLVGAAMTQRPDLMNAVICAAPLLDMVRYTMSELGPTWTVEYGDPEIPEQLDWLLGYSPYHRVVEGTDYPATMFVSFDSDTRTDPMHARKMCAAVQHATSSERPIVFRGESEVGHGARSLNRSVEEAADALAFAARWTGME